MTLILEVHGLRWPKILMRPDAFVIETPLLSICFMAYTMPEYLHRMNMLYLNQLQGDVNKALKEIEGGDI